MHQRAIFVVIALGTGLAGCSFIQEKASQISAMRSVMQPGHAYRSYSVPADAMAPTIPKNSVVIGDLSAYQSSEPVRGDIVLLYPPTSSKAPFVKRIVGMPGDTFEMLKGAIEVDGIARKEPYVAEKATYSLAVRNYGILVSYGDGWQRLDPNDANIPPRAAWKASDRIPKGYYLVFGDNRNDSEDSHIWGFAQDSKAFASGPDAGQPAVPFVKVVKILPPTSR